jgi:hypothetical protein
MAVPVTSVSAANAHVCVWRSQPRGNVRRRLQSYVMEPSGTVEIRKQRIVQICKEFPFVIQISPVCLCTIHSK